MKYFLLIPMIVLASCKFQNNIEIIDRNAVLVNLDIKTTQDIPIRDFVDSVQIIILETTESSMLGEISQVFFSGDSIFVVDKVTASVYAFDYSGKYLNKIAKQGRGPGEYTKISNVIFDETKKRIMIFDGNTKKMICYDQNGKFLHEIPDFSKSGIFRDIVYLPDGNFLCARFDQPEVDKGYGPKGVWEVDSMGNFVRYRFELKDIYPLYPFVKNSDFYTLSEGRIGFSNRDLNENYYITEDSIYKYIAYNFNYPTVKDFLGNSVIPGSYILKGGTHDKGDYILNDWSILPEGDVLYTLYDKENTSVLLATSIHVETESLMGIIGIFRDSNLANAFVLETPSYVVKAVFDAFETSPSYKEFLAKIMPSEIIEKGYLSSSNPILQLWFAKSSHLSPD